MSLKYLRLLEPLRPLRQDRALRRSVHHRILMMNVHRHIVRRRLQPIRRYHHII